MKTLKQITLLTLLLVFSLMSAMAQKLPNIHILATGGTIAGTGSTTTGSNYTAGQAT